MQLQSLKRLIENFDISGLKTSFEDEGANIDDVLSLVQIANLNSIPITIKIGGCEARTDIHTCKKMKINNLVAPMIESRFAVKKYVEAINSIYNDLSNNRFYINIESIAAVNNAEEIIREASSLLSGIVVGRSDLCKSLDLTKDETNSQIILEHTKTVLRVAKKYNLETTFGGNLNSESLEFINILNSQALIDRVETRTVICNVNNQLFENYQKFIDDAIGLEKEILEGRLEAIHDRQAKISKRITAISGRKGFLSKVVQSEKSVLVIDFDNVIHNMTKGYHDGTIYGDMLPAAYESLEKLASRYKIIVYTCKANPARPLVDGKTGVELVTEWLIKNNLKQFVDSVTFNKPNAIAYIDDKAVEFSSWDSCMETMKQKGLI